MELADVLLKVADNKPLTPQERDFLHRTGTDLQLRAADVGGMGKQIMTQAIHAQDAYFDRLPNGYMVMDKTSATTVSDSTQTTITGYQTWTPATGDTVSTSNQYFDLDTTNGRIYIKKANRQIGFYVFNVWDANALGYRSARVVQYNKDGTEITSSNVFRLSAPPTNNFVMAGTIFIPWSSPRDVGDYASLVLFQTSGGALDLNTCAFGAFVIR